MVELTPFVVIGLALCFLWSGFIRSGLGFGGLVLTLPFALMVVDSPMVIMPLAIVHAFVVGVSTVVLGFTTWTGFSCGACSGSWLFP